MYSIWQLKGSTSWVASGGREPGASWNILVKSRATAGCFVAKALQDEAGNINKLFDVIEEHKVLVTGT